MKPTLSCHVNSLVACVAGAKREGGGGRVKSAKEAKREGSLPSFPNPPLFSLPSYLVPISTPATQANSLASTPKLGSHLKIF